MMGPPSARGISGYFIIFIVLTYQYVTHPEGSEGNLSFNIPITLITWTLLRPLYPMHYQSVSYMELTGRTVKSKIISYKFIVYY